MIGSEVVDGRWSLVVGRWQTARARCDLSRTTNDHRRFMSLRAQLESIIYAAETPISLDQISSLVKESLLAETPGMDTAEIKSRVCATLEELIADYSGAGHGNEIRQVAGGYRMATKPEAP